MTMMHYKGYEAVVELDEEAEIFHGEVINLRDVITFQGASAAELKQAFAESVEDYLVFCAERGEEKGFSAFNFEECIAHFKANPPVGGRMDLDFTAEEIQRVRDHAERYGCTVDSFLAAVLTCFQSELECKERS